MQISQIFVFRNDLRYQDNTALNAALKQAALTNTYVLPIFIVNPLQIDKNSNQYASDSCIQFMVDSLQDLHNNLSSKEGKLYLFHGETILTLETLLSLPECKGVQGIWVNSDYTPYARTRDSNILKLCNSRNIKFSAYEDRLLHALGSIKPNTGSKVYLKFSPFFSKASQIPVREVSELDDKFYKCLYTGLLNSSFLITDLAVLSKYYKFSNNCPRGGRTEALKIIDDLPNFVNYEDIRDFPSKNTTQLSAHNKFGTLSIRELYWHIYYTLGVDSVLIKQLYWRDFYYNIIWVTNDMSLSTKSKYDSTVWHNDLTLFDKWKTGQTGFPLIDAGMRQLNETGCMPNRVRMAVADFLVKLLMIDWRWGEKYFAQKLHDYDPAINNGNWQWVAGSGADAQPYFRVFNPWTQSEKFDADCVYIKKWCPELSNVPSYAIHSWFNYHSKFKTTYPTPIIDYEKSRQNGIKLYKDTV